jgi:hypothetical protein
LQYPYDCVSVTNFYILALYLFVASRDNKYAK